LPIEDSADEDVAPSAADRWATWTFVAAAVAAVPYILVQGRSHWFFLDDYDFLAARRLGSFSDLMRSHNGHWSTLPIVEYRLLYHLFGLNHYWPYQAVVVLAHVATAALLYLVMRRARVNPWIATAAGVLFLFLGSGADDIESAFQVGFTGALAFGLAFLVLVDRDGPLGRRDVLGMVCGLAALMCSAVGVAVVAAVGVATLIRRGLKTAAVLVGPLAAVFLAWYVGYGHDVATSPSSTLTQKRIFVWASVSNVFGQLAHVPLVGWLLAGVLVAGAVVAFRTTPISVLRRRDAAIGALLLGGLAFIAITTVNRAWAVNPDNDGAARVSRYVYVGAAFFLPAIAAAASYLARRRGLVILAVAILLLVGLPGNFDHLYPQGGARLTLGRPALIVALARSPLLAHAPAGMHPAPLRVGADLTPRWLRQARDDGKLPMGTAVTPSDRSTATLALSLEQVATPRRHDCRTVGPLETSSLRPGDEVRLREGVWIVSLVGPDGQVLAQNSYFAGDRVLRVLAPVDVRVSAAGGPARAGICTA